MTTSTPAITALVGETLIAVTGMKKGSDEVVFVTESGKTYRMLHHQDCCEGVAIEDVVGDPNDLLNTPILKAEETTSNDHFEELEKGMEYPPSDSWTWTFYHLATVKGYVTLRWLGESNGYYSESVDFEEVK